MGRWGYYPRYVSVAEKRAKAEKKLAQLKKKNPDIRPVVIQGNAIATTWWGKSWNKNLERYADYVNRIGRGRSYVRNGMVLDLQIHPGNVTAMVQGTGSSPYEITIDIKGIGKGVWADLKRECQGKLDSLQALLDGEFPKAMEDIFMAKGKGLFPTPGEIEFDCSCPDWASMCKHVASALYGVGARLDDDPMLFFTLRKVDVDDLISKAVEDRTRSLLEKADRKSGRVIQGADIAGMFGIDMDEPEPPAEPAKKPPRKPRKPKTAPKKPKAAAAPRKAAKRKKAEKPAEKPVVPPPAAEASAIDTVEAIIRKSRRSISLKTVMKRTEFDERKVYNAVYRLVKLGRIVRTRRGMYKKS